VISSLLRSLLRTLARALVPQLAGDAPQTTLTVAISDSLDPVISHVNFNYSVVVTNTGGVTAQGVTATIALDSSLTYVSSSGTGWVTNHVAGVVTCTRASVPVGAAPTITVTVTSADAASTEATTADAVADNAPAATQDSENTVVKLVDRDATRGVRCPADSTQWADFVAYHVAIGTANFPATFVPLGIWPLQEPALSTSAADASGNGFTLTLTGTMTFGVTVAGWTRKGVSTTNGTPGKLQTVAVGIPNVLTDSALLLAYVNLRSNTNNRTIMQLGTTYGSNASAYVFTGGKLEGRSGANRAQSTAVAADSVVRPISVNVNKAAPVHRFGCGLEQLTPTIGTVTGRSVMLGADNVISDNPGAFDFLYAVLCNAAGGANLTSANLAALESALGF